MSGTSLILPHLFIYVAPRVFRESGRFPRHSESPHSKDTGDISMGKYPILQTIYTRTPGHLY